MVKSRKNKKKSKKKGGSKHPQFEQIRSEVKRETLKHLRDSPQSSHKDIKELIIKSPSTDIALDKLLTRFIYNNKNVKILELGAGTGGHSKQKCEIWVKHIKCIDDVVKKKNKKDKKSEEEKPCLEYYITDYEKIERNSESQHNFLENIECFNSSISTIVEDGIDANNINLDKIPTDIDLIISIYPFYYGLMKTEDNIQNPRWKDYVPDTRFLNSAYQVLKPGGGIAIFAYTSLYLQWVLQKEFEISSQQWISLEEKIIEDKSFENQFKKLIQSLRNNLFIDEEKSKLKYPNLNYVDIRRVNRFVTPLLKDLQVFTNLNYDVEIHTILPQIIKIKDNRPDTYSGQSRKVRTANTMILLIKRDEPGEIKLFHQQ